MKLLLSFLLILLATNTGIAQKDKTPVRITNPGKQFELIGDLGEKIGDTVTVSGVIVEGPFKGYEGGPNMIVQRINDKSTQQLIQIPVLPYFGKFGDKPSNRKPLPALQNGSTYRFRVYETGEFVGIPSDAYCEAGIMLQTTGFYFRNRLTVISGQNIEPIKWSPKNFIDRNALLSGIAKNDDDAAVIQTSRWKLLLTGVRKWADKDLGKTAEVHGTIRKTDKKNAYRVEKCRCRLVKLEDQLGEIVKLRGTARSLNGHWWFNYRGTDMYVEKMDQLPNWSVNNHWRAMEITGTLEKARLPRIDHISLKSDRDLATYYIVRNPKWVPVDALLTPELPPRK